MAVVPVSLDDAVMKASWDGARYALFSKDGRHRYLLGRRPGGAGGLAGGEIGEIGGVLWCMLNPSKASHEIDDATIRRVRGFSEDWGFASFEVVNLYSLIDTYPEDMLRQDFDRRIGPANVAVQERALARAELVVCAWGANMEGENAHWHAFVGRAIAADKQPFCLGRTAGGHPKHPLRLAKTTALEPFELG